MRILAIDPGPAKSALVEFDGLTATPIGILPNEEALLHIGWRETQARCGVLVVERIASLGMAVGAEVFETCVWTGRFIQHWQAGRDDARWERIERMKVKMHLCHDSRAKDANIRRALLDRFGGDGAKKKGGLLYGFKADLWAALAVAATWHDWQEGPQETAGPLQTRRAPVSTPGGHAGCHGGQASE